MKEKLTTFVDKILEKKCSYQRLEIEEFIQDKSKNKDINPSDIFNKIFDFGLIKKTLSDWYYRADSTPF